MTQLIKDTLNELNKNYFNDHIEEIVWSSERVELRIKMTTKTEGVKDEFKFTGDLAKAIYKKLAQ